ncbi:MAG TPA: tRNA pseudouridine(38-40) synthase TruA [Vicinamibacteria bacterium]|nr:tRNA pseudouridine(38-40) synthase TruA [Vicinamibacteria bacterium]
MDAPAARNLRLLLEYDGTEFRGWQRQAPDQAGNDQRTVQGCLEAAVKAMTGEDVLVRGAGRTDAGVHAKGQVANLHTGARIPTGGFLRGLNANLPPDVAVLEVHEVPPAFDARRAARGKLYRYAIWNHLVRAPLHRRTSWHCRAPLDLAAMRAATARLEGEHDFRAFRAADCERRTTVRLLRRVELGAQGALVTLDVEGTAFLKHMVRILSGTLVAVGRGELSPDDVSRLLEAGDRTQAGMTAPAAGLTLIRVDY